MATMWVREARDRLGYLAYSGGWRLVRLLPERGAYALFERIADVAWHRRGSSVRQLERNLARIRPGMTETELRKLSRAGMRSYLRYWCDAFRMPGWDHARRVAVMIKDEHLLRDPLNRGQGVIAALPHSGNWDHAGAWIAGTGVPFTTVAERLRPERLYERFVAYRESLGMEVLPLTGRSDTFTTLARRLKAGRLICLLADRDLSRTGVEVTFFGEPARMPGGPAALALMTGAALVPAHVWYDGPNLRIDFGPVIEHPAAGSRSEKVAVMTQQLASVFERRIADHPEDWHMMARLWVADLADLIEPKRAS